MTTIEHLNKIKAKSQELVLTYPPCESTAGWRSTIAAIDDILTVDQDLTPEVQSITTDMLLYMNGNLVQSILSA